MDHLGSDIFHSREHFLQVINMISAELRFILWTVQSLHDLHVEDFEVLSDCSSAIAALAYPNKWPWYRSYLDQIGHLLPAFISFKFRFSSPQANSLTIYIAKIVTKEGVLNSYLARGGTARSIIHWGRALSSTLCFCSVFFSCIWLVEHFFISNLCVLTVFRWKKTTCCIYDVLL